MNTDVWPHAQLAELHLTKAERQSLSLDPEGTEWLASDARDMWIAVGRVNGAWALVDGAWRRFGTWEMTWLGGTITLRAIDGEGRAEARDEDGEHLWAPTDLATQIYQDGVVLVNEDGNAVLSDEDLLDLGLVEED